MAETHIDITLEMNGRQMDLRIPLNTTVARLSMLIDVILREQGVQMPDWWHLRVAGKPLRMAGFKRVRDFPVSDGDVFIIVTDDGRDFDHSTDPARGMSRALV